MNIEEILKCPYCGKKFIQEKEHTWKPDCFCAGRDLRISVGGKK